MQKFWKVEKCFKLQLGYDYRLDAYGSWEQMPVEPRWKLAPPSDYGLYYWTTALSGLSDERIELGGAKFLAWAYDYNCRSDELQQLFGGLHLRLFE